MKTVTPLQLPLLDDSKQKTYWGNLQGSSLSLTIAEIAKTQNRLCLIITPDNTTSNYLESELDFFLKNQSQIPIIHFPDRETLAYDIFSPHQDITSERLLTLYRLPDLKHGILIASVSTLMHYLPPQSFLQQHSFAQTIGNEIVIDDFRKRLANANYRSVSEVLEHGEYAIRGSIIDIFPMGSEEPYRIDLFDNEIESIRTFDPETQKSISSVDKINLLPAREFPLTEEAITHFRQKWRDEFSGNPLQSPIYQAISDGQTIAGIEYYLPLFFDHLANFFDYLPEETLIFKLPNLVQSSENFWSDVTKRFEQKRYDLTRPLLSPETLFLKSDHLFHAINQFKLIELSREAFEKEHNKQLNFETIKPTELPIERKKENPLYQLESFINNFKGRILLCAESLGRREALLRLLEPLHISPTYCESWNDFLNSNTNLGIAVAPLETGFCLPRENIALIAESQIFGLQVLQTRRRGKTTTYESDSQIKDLLELNIGAPVVHIEHGIGRYLGLQTLTVGEITAEYLILEYADQNKLYVPVNALNLITRYTGANIETVPLSKLGTEQWARAKRKAIEKIHDVAAELLKLHAKRASKKGFSFVLDEAEYAKFSSAFAFETTDDQEKAINDVFNDMQQGNAMDRLICGDVGFGKTEVAMRAAFLAVLNNKQVAVLVPTTLLAQQHYQTFCDRMAEWPIRIEMLSRFRTSAEQTKILSELKENKYDIVVGTHKLLQKNIEFHNLGLLVVDEEHRFGVQQKEKIKQLRAEVDILTLTATPIPRTLNMALSGVRDLSIIATPPAKRLAIKTFVQEYNSEIVREGILREIARGGQIYYLYNEVTTIENKVAQLKK
ncbi:MAG: transcription-repair coupling factor, partial [Gammaproteobacteria bacterium]